ncbi:MAG TPA: NAD(P)-dependent oxidoreductase [Myxococcales bacterium]|nr:NAD(P)-dependent oxidoreductase [Myxococcales bacterium]
MSLQGKTIFLTGGSRGIGRAIALRCAREGANIAIAAKTSDPHPTLPGTIHSVAAEVEEAGGRALPLLVDVRNDARIDEAVGETVNHFGGLDAVINNAGAISLTPTTATPMKRVDLMIGINVRAAYACSRAAIPFLKKGENSHIINMSPPIDLDPRWLKNHVAYTISKYGMSMCTIGMSAELAGAGIAVNSLWPRTVIDTAALRLVGGMALAKNGRTPEIMADAVVAILTSNSREVTGNCFIDEDLLRTHGVTDFEHYAVEPGNDLLTDLYVDARPQGL